jgi:flagellar biosynthesis protein FlhB
VRQSVLLGSGRPRFSRLNPIDGFKRVYNRRVVVEGVKAIVKLACFAVITVGFFEAIWPALPVLLNGDAQRDSVGSRHS